jgi:hypothetical protein
MKKSRSRMNIPDLIFEKIVSVLWVKNTSIVRCGSGSGINIPDSQRNTYIFLMCFTLRQLLESNGDWKNTDPCFPSAKGMSYGSEMNIGNKLNTHKGICGRGGVWRKEGWTLIF